MIFNKFRVFVAALVLAGCMVSCDWLQTYPEGETLLEDFWKSESDVESMVAACYRSMLESSFMSSVIQWGELRSDNVMSDGTKASTDQKDIQEMNILPSNGLADWSTFYVTINYCNTVLHYAPGVCDIDKNFSESRMKALCAEVLAIRALCYLYLVRTFGDVPLQLEPTIDDSKGFDIAKTPGSTVLDSMIVSLKEAKAYAQSSFGSSNYRYNKGRFTQQSIRTLLADIYLWQGYYAECEAECNEFININDALADPTQKQSSGSSSSLYYQLVDADYMLSEVFYSGNSSESIFELQFNRDQVANKAVTSLYGDTKTLGQMYVNTTDLSMHFGMSDVRYTYFVGSTGTDEPQAEKYVASSFYLSPQTGNYSFNRVTSPIYTDWIFYRLPEVYLMKAEAIVEQSGDEDMTRFEQAMKCINVSYLRSNPHADSLRARSYPSKSQMRELVLDERQREFMFEGKRWFDIIRQARKDGNTNTVMQYFSKYSSLGQNKLKDINALYMPISKSEMESNQLMEQNPFYRTDETVTAN